MLQWNISILPKDINISHLVFFQLLLSFDTMIQSCFEIAEMHSENDVEFHSVWSTISFVTANF